MYALDADGARALAQALHQGQLDADGAPLLDHIRRVAASVSDDVRVVAWLHEALERTSVPEEVLLEEGLSIAELRAVRLLTWKRRSPSSSGYLAHVEWIATARGPGARTAREVKRADLEDRLRSRRQRAGEWLPPYKRALALLDGARPAAD